MSNEEYAEIQGRSLKRDQRVAEALDYKLYETLQIYGIEMLGIAFKHGPSDCLMTLKAYVGGTFSVCFIGSESMASAILKAVNDAENDRLTWRPDKYHKSNF